MKKVIGRLKNWVFVEGNPELLLPHEIVVSKKEGMTILRRRMPNGHIGTFAVVPLDVFNIPKHKKDERDKRDNSPLCGDPGGEGLHGQ